MVSLVTQPTMPLVILCDARLQSMCPATVLLAWCYIVGLGLNCKFIDLLFKCSVIEFIKISFLFGFIVSEIIYSQTDTLT